MTPQEIKDLFFYRQSPYAIKTSQGHYLPVRVGVGRLDALITDQIIEKHMRGEHTIGVYQSRPDETCMWACIDFDLLSYRDVAHRMAEIGGRAMLDNPGSMVTKILLEPSESRGYHIWYFFREPVSTESAYDFLISLLMFENLHPERDTHIDIFPRSPHLSGKRLGWLVRLPRGI